VNQVNTNQQASVEIGNYWERVGWLVRSGHIDRRIVYAYVGNSVRLWWALMTPNVHRLRELQQDTGIYEHFEWLADLIAAMDRQAGFMRTYDDEAYLAQLIQSNIEGSLSAIQLAEELRAVLLRPIAKASPTPDEIAGMAPIAAAANATVA
jgi:uncharacterized protein YaeQ